MGSGQLHVGIMGAGAVGCYVGGRLLEGGSAEVTFVGRERLQGQIAASGLSLEDLHGEPTRIDSGKINYETDPSRLADCDVVLVAVKSGQTREAGLALANILAPRALVVSLQNGVRNGAALRECLEPRSVLAGIVEFNVVFLGNATFRRATDGGLVLEDSSAACGERLFKAFADADVSLRVEPEIQSQQWTKLLVNLSNAISALSGAPTQDLLAQPGYRRVIAAVLAEAIDVLRAAQVPLAKLRSVPVGVMPAVLRLPTPLVRLITGRQVKVDPEARSSMWQDLTMGRATEIDHLNGEIVRVAEEIKREAPINQRIVELVHQAERLGGGSPRLDPTALWNAVCVDR